jgi:hypothetical protein
MNIGVMQVEIVRPKKTGWESVGTIIGTVVGYLISGWAVMAILGVITTLNVSYWDSVLLVVLVRVLTWNGEHLQWTKAAK